MFRNLRAIFVVFRVGHYRSILHCCKSMFTLQNTACNAEHLVDTCGSGFSFKTATIISLLFGGFHLSLMRLSDEHQNKGSQMEGVYQHSETREQFSEVLGKHKSSYVAELVKKTLERSLISLIESATAKVKLALDQSSCLCQLSHETDYTVKQNEVIDEQRKRTRHITLDDLVRNADARKEIDKIIRVVSIGRGEKEIQDHPLLTLAESTAYILMREMDYVEALN